MPRSSLISRRRFALGLSASALAASGAVRAQAVPGVSATEVLLGQSASFSGSFAGQAASYRDGALACFAAVNAAGGIHGRRIKLLSVDDAYDAQRASENTKRLIEEDQVFALFNPMWTNTVKAALALSAAMPAHPLKERATLFTVIGVSTLSTLAMVLYPMLTHALDMPPVMAGFFIGGTIHDVAQVVGAGYSLSHEAGDAATLVKLMRVAMLLPVIALAAVLARRYERAQGGDVPAGPRPPLLPWFAVAFAVLVLVNSSGWLPAALVQAGQGTSQFLLVASMAAIGMKTQLREIVTVGWKPVALMVLETAFLAALFWGLLQLS